MKILVVSNCAPYEFLGAGLVINRFTEGLVKKGHEVEFYTSELLKDYSEDSSYFGYRYHQMIKIFFYILGKTWQLKNYDLIEFYGGVSSLAIFLLKKIIRYKGKIILHTNAIEIRQDEYKMNYSLVPKRWYQLSEKAVTHYAYYLPDVVVTVSEDEANWLKKYGYPKSGLVKSVNPGLSNEFKRINIDFAKKENIIVFCGNWLPRKGIDVLIQVIPSILKKYPSWKFLIIGTLDSFYISNYFPTDVLNQIENIPFLKDKRDLIYWYKLASICIVPSLYESFGLVMAESMSCGCALLTSSVGFGSELQDFKDAIIVDLKNIKEVEEKIELLIIDNKLRLDIAKAGYNRVQSLEWSKSISELSSFYENLMKS